MLSEVDIIRQFSMLEESVNRDKQWKRFCLELKSGSLLFSSFLELSLSSADQGNDKSIKSYTMFPWTGEIRKKEEIFSCNSETENISVCLLRK